MTLAKKKSFCSVKCYAVAKSIPISKRKLIMHDAWVVNLQWFKIIFGVILSNFIQTIALKSNRNSNSHTQFRVSPVRESDFAGTTELISEVEILSEKRIPVVPISVIIPTKNRNLFAKLQNPVGWR